VQASKFLKNNPAKRLFGFASEEPFVFMSCFHEKRV